jgi:hypothetical protein
MYGIAASAIILPAGTLRPVRSCSSSGAIITLAKYRSTRCGGASFPIGARTRLGNANPSMPRPKHLRSCPAFREAYRKRRCIVPVDGFFEWKAIKGRRAKQPYAIAMKNGSPFGIAGIWENWKDPKTGEWLRTFAIITTDANTLVADTDAALVLPQHAKRADEIEDYCNAENVGPVHGGSIWFEESQLQIRWKRPPRMAEICPGRPDRRVPFA